MVTPSTKSKLRNNRVKQLLTAVKVYNSGSNAIAATTAGRPDDPVLKINEEDIVEEAAAMTRASPVPSSVKKGSLSTVAWTSEESMLNNTVDEDNK